MRCTILSLFLSKKKIFQLGLTITILNISRIREVLKLIGLSAFAFLRERVGEKCEKGGKEEGERRERGGREEGERRERGVSEGGVSGE